MIREYSDIYLKGYLTKKILLEKDVQKRPDKFLQDRLSQFKDRMKMTGMISLDTVHHRQIKHFSERTYTA